MGTPDKGKVIPFTPAPNAGRPRAPENEQSQALEAVRGLTLSRRQGLDTVEHALAAPVAAKRAEPAAASPGAAAHETGLDALALSTRFIASLDDLICKRPAQQPGTGQWPKQANRQLEKVAIDIIDMLFGFILNDPQIPRGIKESLLTAQMPVLQMAMREPEFFADWQHPARLLLNDVAPQLKNCAERGGDAAAFTGEFVRGMARVLDDIAPNGAAFAIFHEQLRNFVSGSSAQASPDAAAWQRAEAAARDFLERPLPQIVRDFVAGYWIDVLERTAEQHAEDSPQWQEALTVVEDLAWSLTPKPEEDDRFRLIALVPALLARLNRGLDLIDVAREDRRPFFDALIEAHSAVLRIETTPRPTPKLRREESASEQVGRLQRGDWVELRQEDGSVTRERLTWISPQRGILVFSNHHGQGAIQIAPEDLAERVRDHKATLIFDQPSEESGKNSA